MVIIFMFQEERARKEKGEVMEELTFIIEKNKKKSELIKQLPLLRQIGHVHKSKIL